MVMYALLLKGQLPFVGSKCVGSDLVEVVSKILSTENFKAQDIFDCALQRYGQLDMDLQDEDKSQIRSAAEIIALLLEKDPRQRSKNVKKVKEHVFFTREQPDAAENNCCWQKVAKGCYQGFTGKIPVHLMNERLEYFFPKIITKRDKKTQ